MRPPFGNLFGFSENLMTICHSLPQFESLCGFDCARVDPDNDPMFLKDSHTFSSGMDYLSKLFASYSNTSAVDSVKTVIQTTYKESMDQLQGQFDARHSEMKQYLPVIFMDNFAILRNAIEQKLITIKDIDGTEHSKRIKTFASTRDLLVLMAKMVIRSSSLGNDAGRPGACVDLRYLGNWSY